MCTGHDKLNVTITTESSPDRPVAPAIREDKVAKFPACGNACPGCTARHARTDN
ncbi:MAG: hypothetical protein OQL11_07020 [Gammaproteobacteria bacterium]|nr:hypothetical protein [Gammaproteobacteria bacterium]